LNVPLYLHPGSPPADHWQVLEGRPEMYGATWSWGAEVGGHALRLIFGGVFDRHPSATLILGHMGEFLPFQRSRLDSRYKTQSPEKRLPRLPSDYLGTNVVFTNSGVFSPATLLGAVLEVGADAVMFSVDYPYESSRDAVAGFERTVLSDSDREKVAHGNAERLLRL
jgi:2,3-dihydroxybenzoate decarboxylase